jgi:CHAT domain-containing protein
MLGEGANNIEVAIAAYQAALTVRTREAFPNDWATTQHNLGIAYRNRIQGDKADNIEAAISAYQAALTVITREALPYDWATTQNTLGNAYCDRIQGDRADNIEAAISAYQAALTVKTREALPYDWAITQIGLASAYRDRIQGDRADNIEAAIAAYQAVLTVHTRESFPYEWATAENNLGNAYRNRIQGDRADNIEAAIAAYQAALTVHTRESFPYEWARTQNNLGTAYRNRIQGDRVDNIEAAIAAYQAALTVHTREAWPYEWAMTQHNLGFAYIDRILGDKADNIEAAINACQAALTLRTREALPYEWATTQNILGNAYCNRIQGDRVDKIEAAIAAYQAALTVHTREVFPYDHAATLINLGITYQDVKQFTSAYTTFDSAIATVESLREEIVSGEESKRKQAEYFNQAYRRMVEVCLGTSNITQAIEYVERSKTRNLVEQILKRDTKSIFPPEVVNKLEKYRDEIAIGQDQIQNGKAENPKVIAQYLQQLRQQRNELQNRYLPVGYGFKFDSFQGTLDEGTAIIEWYILDDKILAFILTPTGDPTVWQSQPENREALENWINQYLQNYYNQKDQWRNSLGEELKKLASILHIDEILTQIPNHCEQLILIPHRFLHLFPLHALPVNQNSENSLCLLDLFANGVSYAPSCQLLQQMQKRQRPSFQSLFAIQNPTEDLSFTDLEVESILSYFSSHQVLSKKQATKAALSQAVSQLKEANYLHFSCHGYFNFNSPQNSFLLLADAYVSLIPANANPKIYLKVSDTQAIDLTKCLTLGNLFEQNFDFSQSRLVVLSACETGLIDFTNTSDEYIGLPSGFLYAGSSSVASSLWTVNDLSTSFLMIKFIQILKNTTDISVPLAMNQAQRWLRDATKEELQEWISQLPLSLSHRELLGDWFYGLGSMEKPFQEPYHWAAFFAIGQ